LHRAIEACTRFSLAHCRLWHNETQTDAVIQGHTHWTRPLLNKLSDTVKLVGPTINCEGSESEGGKWKQNPHVQSFVVATDQVGMELLLKDHNIFKCFKTIKETIYLAELGSSKVILDAGYNIDSLMVSTTVSEISFMIFVSQYFVQLAPDRTAALVPAGKPSRENNPYLQEITRVVFSASNVEGF
jgi:hypothetical protein